MWYVQKPPFPAGDALPVGNLKYLSCSSPHEFSCCDNVLRSAQLRTPGTTLSSKQQKSLYAKALGAYVQEQNVDMKVGL